MRKLVSLLLFFCLPVFGQSYWTPHWDARTAAITAHQALAGPQSAMALGDSLTEQQGWWSFIAGCRVINAGFGGITVKEMANRMANGQIPGTPRYVWLMIGTNTANLSYSDAEFQQFTNHYLFILQTLINRGARVIPVSIPPLDKYKVGGWSQGRINTMNSIIYAYAQQYGLYFVNLNYSFMDLNPASDTYGYALPWVTQADGIHLTAQANVLLYQYQAATIADQQAATGLPCWN